MRILLSWRTAHIGQRIAPGQPFGGYLNFALRLPRPTIRRRGTVTGTRCTLCQIGKAAFGTQAWGNGAQLHLATLAGSARGRAISTGHSAALGQFSENQRTARSKLRVLRSRPEATPSSRMPSPNTNVDTRERLRFAVWQYTSARIINDWVRGIMAQFMRYKYRVRQDVFIA